jgi:hypothetical protein
MPFRDRRKAIPHDIAGLNEGIDQHHRRLRCGQHFCFTSSSAVLRLSALPCKAGRSSSDSCGGNMAVTPARPTTLGSDSVTPKIALEAACMFSLTKDEWLGLNKKESHVVSTFNE